MTSPAAHEILRRLGIRFVVGKDEFPSNCPKCGDALSNWVEIHDDAVCCRCQKEGCDFARIVPLRATPSGGRAAADGKGPAKGNGGAAAADAAARRQRELEEARKVFADVEEESEQAGAAQAKGPAEEAKQFDDVGDPEPPPPPPPSGPPPSPEEQLLAELNRDNCVVLDGGKTWVMRFEDVDHAAGGERYVLRVPTFLRFQAFRDFYLNRHIMVDKKMLDIGSWWLAHPQRRQYRGLIFHPGRDKVIDGKYNLWTGWGIEPKKGDWSLMQKHIIEVLAAGHGRLGDYILNWSAWAVQHADLQAEAALVFLGDEGTGKGTFGKALCRMFGNHALHISSSDHLTGRFTGHMRQCIFLFADEAYAPNDRQAEGRIKRLITDDTITIEEKGKTPFEVPNRLHPMLASNHDWVVPAGAYARRFAVGAVADIHRQDRQWFGPLYKQMQNGGYAAMLYDLLRHKLGDFHPREIVRTAALAVQQVRSLSPLDAWWLELLQTAVLTGADDLAPNRAAANRYEVKVPFFDIQGQRHFRSEWRDGLYDQARRSSPKLKGTSDHLLGAYLREQGCKNKVEGKDGKSKAVWVHRERGWIFPALADCRKKWNDRFPDQTWDATEDWVYPKDDPNVGETGQQAAEDDPF